MALNQFYKVNGCIARAAADADDDGPVRSITVAPEGVSLLVEVHGARRFVLFDDEHALTQLADGITKAVGLLSGVRNHREGAKP